MQPFSPHLHQRDVTALSHWVFNFYVSSLLSLLFFFLLLYDKLHRSLQNYLLLCTRSLPWGPQSIWTQFPNMTTVLLHLCPCMHFFSLLSDDEYATYSRYPHSQWIDMIALSSLGFWLSRLFPCASSFFLSYVTRRIVLWPIEVSTHMHQSTATRTTTHLDAFLLSSVGW